MPNTKFPELSAVTLRDAAGFSATTWIAQSATAGAELAVAFQDPADDAVVSSVKFAQPAPPDKLETPAAVLVVYPVPLPVAV